MKAFFDPRTDAHAPEFFLLRGRPAANEERAERAARLLAALTAVDLAPEPPAACGIKPAAAVHSAEYLTFLETAWPRWRQLPQAGTEVVANVHPIRRDGPYPQHIVGQAGWHMADCACPIGQNTWAAALAAAETAVAAADAVIGGGADAAYALCRPPGHHAEGAIAGGHCFLNNAAIAAERLRARAPRVAVLDIDVHHGNGTQAIFYERADVLTISVHADPLGFYPFFCGFPDERGAGPGDGFNRNMALPHGAGDDPWIAAIEEALAAIARFDPGALVLSLGHDAAADDPLGALSVSAKGFRRAGAVIAGFPRPIAMIQEGGYLSDALTRNAAAFFEGFLATR